MFEHIKIKMMKEYLFLEYPACSTCRMSEEKQLELLASDGKLVKRPLVIGEDFVLVGFKPEEWKTVLLK